MIFMNKANDRTTATWPQIFSTLALTTLLVACGGGGGGSNGGGFLGNGDDNAGDDAGSGGNNDGNLVPEDQVVIGAVRNNTFVTGVVDIGVSTLAAGGTTTATVNLVDGNNNPITSDFTVTFSSDCVGDGTATITSPVLTVGGQAQAEYVANGCVGNDEIRAATVFNNQNLTAIGNLTVDQDNVGSIEFVSASPSQIALAGTGGTETSSVAFRVVGQGGTPIQNVNVTFSLNATTGGLSLSTDSAMTDADGVARTIVSAGTVATSVRVTATETSTNTSTQSSQLVVSTGIPDTNSFSLSNETCHNPEAFNYDGETAQMTIRAADAFNNPVPDGTTISFYTEGGSIDPSCSTGVGGACTVTWRSQNPRPADGFVSVLATAIGNESFTDQNGNGRFDDGESFTDVGEAFADENDSGTYDLGEFFIDFGPGGMPDSFRNDADGDYNGVLCADPGAQNECSADRSITVSEQQRIVMSRSTASADVLYQGGVMIPPGSTIDVAETGTAFVVRMADIAENAMPCETNVTVDVTTGYSTDGTTTATVPNGLFPSFFSGNLLITQSNATSGLGQLTITFETPNGDVTSFSWTLM